MGHGLHEIAELFYYPINCPACQDTKMREDCHICNGLGEIELKLSKAELTEIYKGYIELANQEGTSCPYMQGEHNSQHSNECPFTGAHKKS